MYIHDSLNFKSRRNLDINTKNVESLSVESISKNTVLSRIYRPPDGDFKAFNTFLKNIYPISLKFNKLSMSLGTLTLTLLITTKRKSYEISEFNI